MTYHSHQTTALCADGAGWQRIFLDVLGKLGEIAVFLFSAQVLAEAKLPQPQARPRSGWVMKLVGPSLPTGIRAPSLFPGGAWEQLGQSPTRNFPRLFPISKGGVGGLGEHLGKMWGVGGEGGFEDRKGIGEEERGEAESLEK